MQIILKDIFLFFVGAILYYCLEVIFRGYSHYSMFILGGICFLLIGSLDESKKVSLSVINQMLIGSVIITVLELITGLIVNVQYNLKVWDYSALPLNYKGQICLLFSALWFLLSYLIIKLDNYLRYVFF